MNTRILLLLCLLAPSYAVFAEGEQQEKKTMPQSSRKRRSEARKKKQRSVGIKEMPFEMLITRANEVIAQSNWQKAIDYLRQALVRCEDPSKGSDITLQIADILFDHIQDYVKARRIYVEFVALYPGDAHARYALYRGICASHKCILSPDRDQTPTHETIELADQFLQDTSGDIKYRDEVIEIRTACYRTLIESELNVSSYYRIVGNTTVAQNRLSLIEQEWAEKFPETKTLVAEYKQTYFPSTDTLEEAIAGESTLVAEQKQRRMADRF